jgi:photosystem II stability/assembly factor-like uncharacterized protein
MMSKSWQKLTSLPDGITISGMSATHDASALWLCSPAGLFCEMNGLFVQQVQGIPFRGASAVLAVRKHVLAAGYPNSIVHSFDAGNSWFSSRVEQIASVVTCFVASPNFDCNAMVLAGSDGDGVLRSTDGGNSWQLSNFGLRSLRILALACAPLWERNSVLGNVTYNYEVVFAATEEGVYLSPNAGRAWQFAGQGLPDAPALSLAVSPDFKRTPTLSGPHFRGVIFAGTDGAGLYRSQDGGQTWGALTNFPAQATVNALLFDSRGRLLAGTGEHGLLASSDLGETWFPLLDTEDVILCLAEHGNRLLAGTAENGLLACEG